MKKTLVLQIILLTFIHSNVSAESKNARIELGKLEFANNCAHCHGGNGQGAQLGPSIINRVAAEKDTDLVSFLRKGNPIKGMPSVSISEDKMDKLIGYLRFLSATIEDSSTQTFNKKNQYSSMPSINVFKNVTNEILLNPSDDDWLWFSRTPDAQRFSPLDQINTSNIDQLELAWSLNLSNGVTETIPTVYDGVMYLILPGSSVAALDATTGDTIWEYRRNYDASPKTSSAAAIGRAKTLSIFEDMIYFTAPDETIVALDARTGGVRWEAKVPGRDNTSGSIVVDGKVVSGGACKNGPRIACSITAHDAYTGELLWRFFTTQAPDDPTMEDTWGGLPVSERIASTWGLPGSFDPSTGLIYWSISNPMPITRTQRHNGNVNAVSYSAPSDLFSNSTVAINATTGKLAWYYQHLPGDDWDQDMNQERIVIRTPVNPDPEHVRWINPNIKRREKRDVVVNVGEGGGIWVLDKKSGGFIWSTPFPFNVENYILEDIDVETGRTYINRELVLDEPGEHKIICYFNTRSFWPVSYNPNNNSLYVPYIRNCLNMTSATSAFGDMPAMPEARTGIAEPGVPRDELNGLAKVDMETGEMTHWATGVIPTNSAILATAGNLIFMGDINRRYWAMDANSGKILWEKILGGPISVSNITYAVDGRQYIAVITGETLSYRSLNTGNGGPFKLNLSGSRGGNALYVFALPQM